MILTIHYFLIRSLSLFIFAALYNTSISPVFASFQAPDMEKELFATQEIEIDKFSKAGLVGALVSVARDFNEEDHQVSLDTRSYALAIAGRIDKDSQKVKECLTQLLNERQTTPLATASKERTANRLYAGIRSLMRRKDNKAHQTCAAYCIDIAIAIEAYPDRKNKLKEYKKNLKDGGYHADWTGTLKPLDQKSKNQKSSSSIESAFLLPGQSSKKTKRMESRIDAFYDPLSILVEKKHRDRTPIVIKVIKDDRQEGILFQFERSVGGSISQSLRESITFMKTHYKESEIPSGYKVLISMNHDKKPMNNFKQGMPLAILIDSLITGHEIHDQHSCFGRVTAKGEVIPVAYAGRSIQKAINQKSETLGMPYRNRRSAYNFFLSEGMQELLKINIFLHKNIPDAVVLARKQRSSNIREAITLYAQLGNLISKKGPEVLQEAQAKSMLKDILQKAPNHVSARVLFDYSEGKMPQKLSVHGSMDELDINHSIYRANIFNNATRAAAKEYIVRINKIKNLLDPRVMGYCNSALMLQSQINQGPNKDESSEAYQLRIKALYSKVSAERKKLLSDKKFSNDRKL